MGQWLELHTLTAEGLGSIPGWGTKIPQAMWYSQKEKRISEGGRTGLLYKDIPIDIVGMREIENTTLGKHLSNTCPKQDLLMISKISGQQF